MSAESFWWWDRDARAALWLTQLVPSVHHRAQLSPSDKMVASLGKGRTHCMERGGWNNTEWKMAEGTPSLEKSGMRRSKQWSRGSLAAQGGDHAGADFSWCELHGKPVQEQTFFQEDPADCGNSPWQSRGKVQRGRSSRETSMYWPWPSIIPLMPLGGGHALEEVEGKELSLGNGWWKVLV